MADALVAALPPTIVLEALASPSETASAQLMRAALSYPTSNKRYRREILQVWAVVHKNGVASQPDRDHTSTTLTDAEVTWIAQLLASRTKPPTDADDKWLGMLLAHHAALIIQSWAIVRLQPAPPEVEARLKTLVRACGEAANMEKTGDRMLHGLLRLQLHPAAVAAMIDEPPYAALNARYGRAANDVVGRWLDTPVGHLPDIIDYSQAKPEDLVVIGSLLEETLDNMDTSVAIAGDVLRRQHPCLCAFQDFGSDRFPDCIAAVVDETLHIAPATDGLAAVVLAWAKADANQDLFLALTDPIALPPGSLMRVWLTT